MSGDVRPLAVAPWYRQDAVSVDNYMGLGGQENYMVAWDGDFEMAEEETRPAKKVRKRAADPGEHEGERQDAP